MTVKNAEKRGARPGRPAGACSLSNGVFFYCVVRYGSTLRRSVRRGQGIYLFLWSCRLFYTSSLLTFFIIPSALTLLCGNAFFISKASPEDIMQCIHTACFMQCIHSACSPGSKSQKGNIKRSLLKNCYYCTRHGVASRFVPLVWFPQKQHSVHP